MFHWLTSSNDLFVFGRPPAPNRMTCRTSSKPNLLRTHGCDAQIGSLLLERSRGSFCAVLGAESDATSSRDVPGQRGRTPPNRVLGGAKVW
eukprot:1637021-Alexandrium_andersonii.AAC.1